MSVDTVSAGSTSAGGYGRLLPVPFTSRIAPKVNQAAQNGKIAKLIDGAKALFPIAIGVFLFACAPAAPSPPVSSPTLPAASTSTPEPSTPTLEASTPSPQPTIGPTSTVWPPVFDLFGLEDILTLDSFVLTVNERNTVNGQLNELTTTLGYIREPYRAYSLIESYAGQDRTYVIDDITYQVNQSGDWYITSRADQALFQKADPAALAGKLVDAQFAGQRDFHGNLANHFVLESETPVDASYSLQGDLYVAQEGNYLLYSHWSETTSQENFKQTYELTAELSSINQVTEITLPSDLQAMRDAMDLPLELGLPLPAQSTLTGMIRYKHGIGVDLYSFRTPKISLGEFLDYYRALPPTGGWTVSHVGHVSLHQEDCEFLRECVILNNGSTQVVLYYDGASIRAEFDWPHLYSPR